jgi:RND family efflux transporter MFP subunit
VKKPLILVLVVVGAGVLVFVGRGAVVGRPARPAGAEIVRVVRRDIGSSVKATGVLRAAVGAEVRVGSQATGMLRRIAVAVGDRVERGQLLAEVDPLKLAARQRRAEAALLSARANLRFAATDIERKRELVASQVLSRSELDPAERNLALAEAAILEARAGLALARVELDEARVLAPGPGVVASVSMQAGETVTAGPAAPTLLTLLDLDRLEVWTYVDETDIGRIEAGQRAAFTVEAYPGRELSGRVVAVHPRPEIRDNVVSYITVVRFSPDRRVVLRPEMTANVRISVEDREGVLALPRRALRRERGLTYVLCPGRGGVARRAVAVGVHDETHIEVVSGLREGEAVIVGDPDRPAPEPGG